MANVDIIQPLLDLHNIFGVPENIGSLALEAPGGLMNHDSRVRHRVPGIRLSSTKEKRTHGGGLPDAKCRDLGLDELHRVINRKTRRDDAARRIDVHRDFLLRIFCFEEQQFGNDYRSHVILDRTGQKNDPFAQKPRIDVEPALAPACILDNLGNEVVVVNFNWTAVTHGGDFPDEDETVRTVRRSWPRPAGKDSTQRFEGENPSLQYPGGSESFGRAFRHPLAGYFVCVVAARLEKFLLGNLFVG